MSPVKWCDRRLALIGRGPEYVGLRSRWLAPAGLTGNPRGERPEDRIEKPDNRSGFSSLASGLSFLGFPLKFPEARPASHISKPTQKEAPPVGYNPYNGYSGKERDEKEAERARLLKSGELQM